MKYIISLTIKLFKTPNLKALQKVTQHQLVFPLSERLDSLGSANWSNLSGSPRLG